MGQNLKKEQMNVLEMGWGYNECGELCLLVSTFTNAVAYVSGEIQDKRIEECLYRHYMNRVERGASDWLYWSGVRDLGDDGNHLDDMAKRYEDFVMSDDWQTDFIVYKIESGGVVNTGLERSYASCATDFNLDLCLSDEKRVYIDDMLKKGRLLPNSIDRDCKVGDVRLDKVTGELVLFVSAPIQLYSYEDRFKGGLINIVGLKDLDLVPYNSHNRNILVMDDLVVGSEGFEDRFERLVVRDINLLFLSIDKPNEI